MTSRIRTSLPFIAFFLALDASGVALAQSGTVAVKVADTRAASAPVATASVLVAPQVTVSSIPGDPLDSHFTADDSNGDGYIDRSEAVVDPGLSRQFDAFDKDRDGRLSRQEYKTWRDWK